jgi:hypothetical protein
MQDRKPAAAPIRATSSGRSSRRLFAIASLAAVVAIAVAFWAGRSGGVVPAVAPQVARFLVNVAPAERLQAVPDDRMSREGRPSRTAITWSPDGRSIIFSAAQGDQQQLYVRTIDRLDATALPGNVGGALPSHRPMDAGWDSGAPARSGRSRSTAADPQR